MQSKQIHLTGFVVVAKSQKKEKLLTSIRMKGRELELVLLGRMVRDNVVGKHHRLSVAVWQTELIIQTGPLANEVHASLKNTSVFPLRNHQPPFFSYTNILLRHCSFFTGATTWKHPQSCSDISCHNETSLFHRERVWWCIKSKHFPSYLCLYM